MRKGWVLTVATVLMACVCAFAGCLAKKPQVIKESDTYIVINVSEEQMEITAETTLVAYMGALKENGELSFEMQNGMVVSVNGIENPADWSSCWMLYTNDTEMGNAEWGTYQYGGQTYFSAILGADTLTIIDGANYLWVYLTF